MIFEIGSRLGDTSVCKQKRRVIREGNAEGIETLHAFSLDEADELVSSNRADHFTDL